WLERAYGDLAKGTVGARRTQATGCALPGLLTNLAVLHDGRNGSGLGPPDEGQGGGRVLDPGDVYLVGSSKRSAHVHRQREGSGGVAWSRGPRGGAVGAGGQAGRVHGER